MIIILFLVFLLFSPFACADAVGIPPGSEAPDFNLSSVDGKNISLSENKGEIVVLIYWRTGQKRSLLALEDGREILKKYMKKGVRVIGLITDTEDRKEVLRIIEDNEIDFPVLVDSGRLVYGDYGIRVYPSTVVIDREGKLVYDIPGHAPIYRVTLEGHLQYLLGEIDEKGLEETVTSRRDKKDQSALEAERRYNLALRFIELGLIDQAIEAAKKSIETRADVDRYHVLLGILFLEMKEAEEALKQFNAALDLNQHSHDAKTGLGGALILKGDIDKAIEILRDASILNPYPQMTYYELGRAYELKGDNNRAVEMYKKALDKIINKQILPSAISKCQ